MLSQKLIEEIYKYLLSRPMFEVRLLVQAIEKEVGENNNKEKKS
jgi:hypothetical protein